MNVYILKRYDKVWWDENRSLVIVAESEKEARKIANENASDEGKIWNDNSVASCNVIKNNQSYVVLIDNKQDNLKSLLTSF